MYKVLIADDESVIRNGLASMVAQHPALEVAALADDGVLALEKAQEIHPDLMLVDINMPFLNGFECIEAIQKTLPETVIVIITGYDDFEFIQKALRLGVVDYILKPIMEEPFFSMLDKVVRRLETEEQSKKYLRWIDEEMKLKRPALINHFFRDWLGSNMDRLEIEDRMQYLDIHFPHPYWVTLIHLHADYEREDFYVGAEWDGDLLYYGCNNIVQEILSPHTPVLTFQAEDGALVLISAVLSAEVWADLRQRLAHPIEKYFRVRLDIVQRQGSQVLDFPEVFESAAQDYSARRHYSKAVQGAVALMNQNWSDSELSLQTLADALYVSPQYLSRLFRRETGDTIGGYLARKRINEAMRLLQDPALKMYEIAQKTGYTSQHYFSSAFKKALGISPVEYRKNIIKRGGER